MKRFVFIPLVMSQHNSARVPRYVAAGQESQTSKCCRNARILSISKLFSPKRSGQFGKLKKTGKEWGVSCTLKEVFATMLLGIFSHIIPLVIYLRGNVIGESNQDTKDKHY